MKILTKYNEENEIKEIKKKLKMAIDNCHDYNKLI
jgi:hypothetical protein